MVHSEHYCWATLLECVSAMWPPGHAVLYTSVHMSGHCINSTAYDDHSGRDTS